MAINGFSVLCIFFDKLLKEMEYPNSLYVLVW